MTINLQVMTKAIRGLFHDKSNISNNRHTVCCVRFAYPAVTISRGYHNPSIPPSSVSLRDLSVLTHNDIFTTPLNEQAGVFLMRDLSFLLGYENHRHSMRTSDSAVYC